MNDHDDHRKQNMSPIERALTAGLSGLALARYGTSSVLGTLLAAGLFHRAVSGHCFVYEALGVDTKDRSTPTLLPSEVQVTKAVTITAEPETIFGYFTTQLEKLVTLSPEVVSLEKLDDYNSRWVVKTPIGQTSFVSRIVSSEDNRRVCWVCEDGQVPHSGEVLLEPTPRGTVVKVHMTYRPPGGKPAVALGRLTGLEPHEALERTLYNLRAQIEAGETPIAFPQPPENTGQELAQ